MKLLATFGPLAAVTQAVYLGQRRMRAACYGISTAPCVDMLLRTRGIGETRVRRAASQ